MYIFRWPYVHFQMLDEDLLVFILRIFSLSLSIEIQYLFSRNYCS